MLGTLAANCGHRWTVCQRRQRLKPLQGRTSHGQCNTCPPKPRQGRTSHGQRNTFPPAGAFLPPAAAKLEAAYKQELGDLYGVKFTSLLTLANMPIKRFADRLHQKKETEKYMNLLVQNFNPGTVPWVMCTSLVSVRWDGACFSCDFNQQVRAVGRPCGASHAESGNLERWAISR